MKDYYALLGLSPDAGSKQVEEAWRRFQQKTLDYLPPGTQADSDTLVRTEFPDVAEAYDVLSDATRRKTYDAGRKTAAPAAPAPRRSPGDKVLLAFNPRNPGRRVVVILVLVVGIIDLLAAGGLFAMFITKGTSEVSAFLHTSSARAETWLSGMIALSLLLICWPYIFNPLARLVTPYRDLTFGHDALYLQLKNGSAERIRAMSCYRYVFLDIIWINLFTESGRRISIYKPLGSCFYTEHSTDELSAFCARAKVQFRAKPFLFLNVFWESAPAGIPRKAATVMLHLLQALAMLGYFAGSAGIAVLALMGWLHIDRAYVAYAQYEYLLPLVFIGLAVMLLKAAGNALDRALVR